MKYIPKPYQAEAIQHVLDNPHSALLLHMGLGKTSITLTAVRELIDTLEVSRVLVVAPLRVIYNVWRQESAKWDHTSGLRISMVHGEHKTKVEALNADADIYLINYEGLIWLGNYLDKNKTFKLPDMAVWDESSKMKDPDTRRFKMMRRYLSRFARSVILTGSPAPNSLINLWAQYYLLDQGERLGKTYSGFRTSFFEQVDYMGHKYALIKGMDKAIYRRIGDITLRFNAPKRDNPPVHNHVLVTLPESAQKIYDELEKEAFVMIDGEGFEAFNAASVMMKCRQMASGFLYNEDMVAKWVHNRKMDALREVLDEAEGDPVLIACAFRAEADVLQNKFKIPYIGGGVSDTVSTELIEAWNHGRLPALAVHPASMGHGVNLQHGGHILVWLGLTWSLEEYEQLNARLDRMGQKHQVLIHHIMVKGTIDHAIIRALEGKARTQNALLEALAEYRRLKNTG